jgi:hypothetical protein
MFVFRNIITYFYLFMDFSNWKPSFSSRTNTKVTSPRHALLLHVREILQHLKMNAHRHTQMFKNILILLVFLIPDSAHYTVYAFG